VLLHAGDTARRLLLAISPALFPGNPSWGERVAVTGYWFLDEPEPPPDGELSRFLAAGDPPVVITFGSMVGFDARKVIASLVAGLGGRRAVLQAGFAGLGEGGMLPASIHRTGFVPHGWLFARAACVVHHGGAGTTASALRAGVPQIIVWHLGDQPAWGKLVAARGLGVKPLHHRRLTSQWLDRALTQVLASEEMRQRAKRHAEHLRAERGLEVAVREVEAAFDGSRR
jgi:UDP:flavonoid glycosyltransferase YjiC (YdhE family)